MKLVLKVSSNNEHCDGGCELALVDLTPQLGATALRRIAVLREQKCLDPDVDETYYSAYVVEYFSPWVSLVSTEEEVEPAVKAANVLDELGIEENEVLTVPESSWVPSCQIAAVECEQMIVRADCIAFTAIPKHASFHVQTVEIPLGTLETAATGASTAHV
jgi:sulfur carrier protein ThiS